MLELERGRTPRWTRSVASCSGRVCIDLPPRVAQVLTPVLLVKPVPAAFSVGFDRGVRGV